MRHEVLWQQQKADFGKEFLDFRRKEKSTVLIGRITLMGWIPNNDAETTIKASKGQRCYSETWKNEKRMERHEASEVTDLDVPEPMSCLLEQPITCLLKFCDLAPPRPASLCLLTDVLFNPVLFCSQLDQSFGGT